MSDKVLCTLLGRKAKELVEGMRERVKRDPDVADYAVAFEAVLTDFDAQVVKVLAPSADALAKEKYYTIEHRSPGTTWRPQFEWIVSGFRDGQLVLQTGHTTESSMQMECRVWESRGYVERKDV